MKVVSVCKGIHTYFRDDDDDYEELMTRDVSNEKLMNGKRMEHKSCI